MVTLTRFILVLRALVIRDLMSRFGRHHLGFVWTILEPMILTAGVMSIWSLIKEPMIHGVPILVFTFTGYMPLTLWRHMTNPMTKILRNNASLLYHRPVSHVQIIMARGILEFLSTTTALLVVYFVVLSTGFTEPVWSPGLTLAAWVLTAWYYGALGVLVSGCTELWEPAEKFIQPMQYLMLPLSGVFFMVDWLPVSSQKLLLVNPSVHCFEMYRAGFLGPSVPTHYDTSYLITSCIVVTVAAGFVVFNVRERLQLN